MAAQEISAQWRSGTGSCQNEEGQQQRSKDSGARTAAAAAAATRGGGVPVWGESAGGWVGLTLSVRIQLPLFKANCVLITLQSNTELNKQTE